MRKKKRKIERKRRAKGLDFERSKLGKKKRKKKKGVMKSKGATW